LRLVFSFFGGFQMVDFKQETRHNCRNICPAMPSCLLISTGRRKKAPGRGLVKRLQSAVIFLSCLIPSMIGGERAACAFSNIATIEDTKSCYAILSKRVAVGQPPVHVKSSSASNYSPSFCFGDRNVWLMFYMKIAPRTDNSDGCASAWNWLVGGCRQSFEWKDGNGGTRPNHDIVRGRLAGIFEAKTDERVWEIKSFDNRPTWPAYIGSKLVAGSSSANHHLPESESREQKGGGDEPSSELRQTPRISGYEAIIYVFLVAGITFLLAGLIRIEADNAVFGLFLVILGAALFLESGLMALHPNIPQQF
jgi:hypothetical protein